MSRPRALLNTRRTRRARFKSDPYHSSRMTLIVVSASDPDPSDPSVRGGYARLGVGAYYRRHAATYRNPHEDGIRAALGHAVADWTPDLSHVLDLAAGSGEVT